MAIEFYLYGAVVVSVKIRFARFRVLASAGFGGGLPSE